MRVAVVGGTGFVGRLTQVVERNGRKKSRRSSTSNSGSSIAAKCPPLDWSRPGHDLTQEEVERSMEVRDRV